jgi:hypothetical protein
MVNAYNIFLTGTAHTFQKEKPEIYPLKCFFKSLASATCSERMVSGTCDVRWLSLETFHCCAPKTPFLLGGCVQASFVFVLSRFALFLQKLIAVQAESGIEVYL